MSWVTTVPGAERPQYGFYVEDCSCGAVRTIELRPEAAPIIRMGVTMAAGQIVVEERYD